MSLKVLGFLAAAALFPITAAAGPSQVWTVGPKGIYVEQAGKPRRLVVLPQWHMADEPYACAPVVAVGPRGEALVASNVLPVLWRIDPTTLAVSMHRLELDADSDKDVGFSGIVYSARDGAYFAVSAAHGTLWRIGPPLSRAQKIALSEPMRGACGISLQRYDRTSRFSRLCVDGRQVNVAPDQRSAYVQAAGCTADAFAYKGAAR